MKHLCGRLVALPAKTDPGFSCGQYYKNILFTNDNPRVVRMTIVSDAPSCGDTYDHHCDDSRDVTYVPREHL